MTRRGFSLIEMVVSLGTVAVIAGAVMSVMVVAARALPARDDRTDRATRVREVLARMSAEIALASEVSEATATSVRFTCPDLDGDGAPDLVRYAWGPTPGKPLTRTLNGVTQDVLGNVEACNLAWTVREALIAGAGSSALGSEQLLASYDDTGATLGSLSLTDKQAQYVLPVLPSDATAYAVTRVGVRIRKGGAASSVLNVNLHPDSGGQPSLVAYASSTLTATGAKSSDALFTASYAVPVELAPSAGTWIVVNSTLGSADSVLLNSPVADGRQSQARGATILVTLSWTLNPDTSMRYELYGKVRRPTDLQVSRVDAFEGQVTLRGSAQVYPVGAVLAASPRLITVPTVDLLPTIELKLLNIIDLRIGAAAPMDMGTAFALGVVP